MFPAKSGAWERFYSNIWDATDYGLVDCCGSASAAPSSAGGASDASKFKLTLENKFQSMGHCIQVAADVAGCKFDVDYSSDKSISPNGRLPLMEINDENKTQLFEAEAML